MGLDDLLGAGVCATAGGLIGRGLAYLGQLEANADSHLLPNLEDLSWTDAFWAGEMCSWLYLNHPTTMVGTVTALGIVSGLVFYAGIRSRF